MKIGRLRTDEGLGYFFLTPKHELVNWRVLQSPEVPEPVRDAAARANREGTNTALCDALPLIEDFLLRFPGFMKGLVGSGRAFDGSMELEPPVTPQKFICVGLNYRDHAAESGQSLPKEPLLFAKTANALNGHNGALHLTPDIAQLDYEAGLVVVIGRRCRNASAQRALSYVAGYTCGNDVSARDLQFESGQWYRGKSVDGFGPIGPWLVTPMEVADPHSLPIRLRLNGQTMQDSNTANLIFSIPELIAYISRTITLLPGDVIMTGTPSGVGFARKPPIYLKSGDRIEVDIEGVGSLVNHVETAGISE